jgi:hypothetical protein
MDKRVQVPRWMFRMWTEGILLDRSGTHIFIVDESLMDEAMNTMNNGGTIYFTNGNKIVSTMRNVGNNYFESAVEGE